MRINPYPGTFIVFEGPDGSGESTQAKLLTAYFDKRGYSVVSTKEPTDESEAGKKVRKILTEKISTDPLELQKLFTEDRRAHLERLIIPSLQARKVVISDRYFFSTFAYGSIDCNLEELIGMNERFILPDATFVLIVREEVCLERIYRRGDRVHLFERLDVLAKVLTAYRSFGTRFKNVHLIDGEKTREEVFSDVLAKLELLSIL